MPAVDDDALGRAGRLGQHGKDAREHAAAGPADVAVVERLVRAIDRRGVAPAQAVALNVNDPAENTPVICPRFATRARKQRCNALDLLVG